MSNAIKLMDQLFGVEHFRVEDHIMWDDGVHFAQVFDDGSWLVKDNRREIASGNAPDRDTAIGRAFASLPARYSEGLE